MSNPGHTDLMISPEAIDAYLPTPDEERRAWEWLEFECGDLNAPPQDSHERAARIIRAWLST